VPVASGSAVADASALVARTRSERPATHHFSVRSLRPGALQLYVAGVSAAGLGALAWLALHQDASSRLAGVVPLLLVAFVFLGELLPIELPEHDDQITVSTTFAYALLLTSGVAAAALVLALASLVADRIGRRPPARIVFNAAQYSLSLSFAGLVQAAFGLPLDPGHGLHPGDLGAVLAGAVAFFVVNNGLAGTAAALARGVSVRTTLVTDLGFQAQTASILLALAPVVVITADFDKWLVPLFALPLLAVHGGARSALRATHQSRHDALTGLPNRVAFSERIEEAIVASRASSQGFAVFLIDLARFTEINDALGYERGDQLLELVGARLERFAYTAARMGGDEFALLVEGVRDANHAHAISSLVHRQLREPFQLGDVRLEVSAVSGGACYPAHGDTAAQLVRHADVALHHAVDAHLESAIFAPDFQTFSPARVALLGQLRGSIDTGELVAYYQPKASLETGRVTGVEALARWQHPEHGTISPGDFVPYAESTGLVRPLTWHILREAAAQLHSWIELGHELEVAVNISPRVLLRDEVVDEVAAVIEESGIPARLLELEVTESTMMENAERALEIITALKSLGVKIAIDDFGTGYSSLAYLKRLPADTLKIDREFITSLRENDRDALIVDSAISLARKLGMSTVAEGVEQRATWNLLADLGCDQAQGYLLAPPMPSAGVNDWLESEDACTLGRFRKVSAAD
jgi:diguanylate cyclase (GGDEF)-like protein